MEKTKKSSGDIILKGIGVRKRNFVIYICCLVAGIVLIAAALVAFVFAGESLADELLMGLGCSTIPTIVAAYLIDRASEKRNESKIKTLRSHFLWFLPYGVMSLMRVVIENYPRADGEEAFYDCFDSSISSMKEQTFDSEHPQKEARAIKKLKRDFSFGMGFCKRVAKSISEHEYELEINDVFSRKELLRIEGLPDDFKEIKESTTLEEMVDLVKDLVDETIDYFPEEIGNRVVRTTIIRNGKIDNWKEITKK